MLKVNAQPIVLVKSATQYVLPLVTLTLLHNAGAQDASGVLNSALQPAFNPICNIATSIPNSVIPGIAAFVAIIAGALMWRFGNQRAGIPLIASSVIWFLLFKQTIAIAALFGVSCAVK